MITQAQIDEHKARCEQSRQELWIGTGPWDDEPHRVEFKAYGLNCLLLRNFRIWNWCGYVGLPPGHPAYGKKYNEIDVQIHGGLTYGNSCSDFVCHIAKASEPDELHWIGFDCAHADDIVPGMDGSAKWLEQMRSYRLPDTIKDLRDKLGFKKSYKTVEYVKNETMFLAEQLSKLGG